MFQKSDLYEFINEELEPMVAILSPDELNYFLSLVHDRLKNLYNSGYYDKENRKNNILKGRFKKGLRCPKCGSSCLNKNGTTNGRQRYLCRDCRITFDERSFTPLSNTKLSLEKWLDYCRYMVEGGSIRMCAKEVGVSVRTSFFMRHRILDMLNYFLKEEILDGIVDTEPCYINESFKGSTKGKMAALFQEEKYFSSFYFKTEEDLRADGKFLLNEYPLNIKEPLKYVRSNQICINTAIDRNGHIISRIVDNKAGKTNNKIKPQDMMLFFKNKFRKDATLCYFNRSLYRELIPKLGIKTKRVSRQNESLYTVNRVFRYHLELKKWIKKFRGVATKYLNNYLAWFKFMFIGKKFKEFNRRVELFMDVATRDFKITQKKIKDRCVESM